MRSKVLAGVLPSGILVLAIMGAYAPEVWPRTVDEAELDAQVREVAKTLRCTVCQSESIWESNAGLARQMREVIRERLKEGQTPEEIRAYFLSRYGDYILLKPRKTGLNWLLWLGPFLLLAVGGAVLYRSLRRWTVQAASEKEEEPLQPLSEQNRRRLAREWQAVEEEEKGF